MDAWQDWRIEVVGAVVGYFPCGTSDHRRHSQAICGIV